MCLYYCNIRKFLNQLQNIMLGQVKKQQKKTTLSSVQHKDENKIKEYNVGQEIMHR